MPPFILQSQLYSSLNDRTQVDRELEVLLFLLKSSFFWILSLIISISCSGYEGIKLFVFSNSTLDKMIMPSSFWMTISTRLSFLLVYFKFSILIFFLCNQSTPICFKVDRIAKRMEENKQSDTDIFKWFKEHVLDSKLEPSIAHHELVRLLSLYSNPNSLLYRCLNFSTKTQCSVRSWHWAER